MPQPYLPPGSKTEPFTSGDAERAFIVEEAKALGILDPQATLAVAAREGVTLPAEVGDSGTSFGPWQLHAGGALPAAVWAKGPTYARGWADSQEGIDYALRQIKSVVGTTTGPEAIRRQVYGFERPANPAAETRAAIATDQQGGGPTTHGTSVVTDVGHAAGAVGGAVSGAAGAVTGPIHSVEDFFKFVTSWRFVEVVGGFLLLLVGLYLLGRQFGLASATGSAVRLIPGVEALDNANAYRQGRRAAARAEGRKTIARQGTGRRRTRSVSATPAGPRRSSSGYDPAASELPY